MNIIPHKFGIGEQVSFIKSVRKNRGIVIAHERSYGLPTYQVKFDNETMTLCEDDIAK